MSTRRAERHGAAHTPSGRAAERRRIVASKLAGPPRRPGIVDRPGLLDGLASATHAPVVLVSAPAGYGKTTLLALWRERDQRPFAWVSLDAADNDPVVLVAGLIAALDPIVGLDAAVGDSLNSTKPPLEEFVLPSLVDACVERDQQFVLVLDDLHLVTERRCHTAIGYLAERLPPGCQLALGTRTDPPLPLGASRSSTSGTPTSTSKRPSPTTGLPSRPGNGRHRRPTSRPPTSCWPRPTRATACRRSGS
jgi:LuxR family maltose regulon positive regulatory protein